MRIKPTDDGGVVYLIVSFFVYVALIIAIIVLKEHQYNTGKMNAIELKVVTPDGERVLKGFMNLNEAWDYESQCYLTLEVKCAEEHKK